jgi:hypothetical protein
MKTTPKRAMNNQPKSRTNLDLQFAILEMAGGPQMVEAFKRQVLPHLSLSPMARQEISEEEYQFGLSKIREELPYFLAYLRDKQL